MIPPPLKPTPEALADWLEANLLFVLAPGEEIPEVLVSRALEGASGEEMNDDTAIGDEGISSTLLVNLRRQVTFRDGLLGTSYPVEFKNLAYRAKGSWSDTRHICYSFLLLLSLAQYYKRLRLNKRDARQPALLFEHLSHKVLELYLHTSSCIRMGAPRMSPVPAGFRQAVQLLANQAREKFNGTGFMTSKVKDDKLDLAAWIPFKDNRAGQLVVLAQCGVGVNWEKKLTDLSPDLWCGHIDWLSRPLMRAMMVPFYVSDPTQWRRACRDGGVFFDRLRLITLVSPRGLDRRLPKQIKTWCSSRLKLLSAMAS